MSNTLTSSLSGSSDRNPSLPERLLSKRQVAELLSVSTRSVERMMARGLLKRIAVGGCVRFRLSEILRVMEGGAR